MERCLGHPAFGEWRYLQLVRRAPRALVGEEEDRGGELAWVGERVDSLAGRRSRERFNARINNQKRDMDALLPEL